MDSINEGNRTSAASAFQTAVQYTQKVTVGGKIPDNEILNVIRAYTAAQTLGSIDAAVVLIGLYNDLLFTDTYSRYSEYLRNTDKQMFHSLMSFMQLSCETAYGAERYDLGVVLPYANLCALTDKTKAWKIIDQAIAAGAPAGKYAAIMLTADGTLPNKYGTPWLKEKLAEIKNACSPELFSPLSKLLYLMDDSAEGPGSGLHRPETVQSPETADAAVPGDSGNNESGKPAVRRLRQTEWQRKHADAYAAAPGDPWNNTSGNSAGSMFSQPSMYPKPETAGNTAPGYIWNNSSGKSADTLFQEAENYRKQAAANGTFPGKAWDKVFNNYADAFHAGSVDAAVQILDSGMDYIEYLGVSSDGRWKNVLHLMEDCGRRCYGAGIYSVVSSYAGLYAYGMGDCIPKNTVKAWSLIDEAIAHNELDGKISALLYVCDGVLPDTKGMPWLEQTLREVSHELSGEDRECIKDLHAGLVKYKAQLRIAEKQNTPEALARTERLSKLRRELDNYSSVPPFLMVIFAFFGFHRIAAGKFATFIPYVLTAFGFGIWLIIDIVTILRGDWTDMNGKIISGRRKKIKREIAALEKQARQA